MPSSFLDLDGPLDAAMPASASTSLGGHNVHNGKRFEDPGQSFIDLGFDEAIANGVEEVELPRTPSPLTSLPLPSLPHPSSSSTSLHPPGPSFDSSPDQILSLRSGKSSASPGSGSTSPWALAFAKASPQPRKVSTGGLGGQSGVPLLSAALNRQLSKSASQATMRAPSSSLPLHAAEERTREAVEGDVDREVGLAVDGTYVETTSFVAAQALAKHYDSRTASCDRKGKAKEKPTVDATAHGQGGDEQASGVSGDEGDEDILKKSEYVVVSAQDRNGRTVYRIRPRSPLPSFSVPSSSGPSTSTSTMDEGIPFPRHQRRHSASPGPTTPVVPKLSLTGPSPSPAADAATEGGQESPTRGKSMRQGKKSLRQARSNPVLRSIGPNRPGIALISPDERGFYPSTGSGIHKGTLFPSPRPQSRPLPTASPSPSSDDDEDFVTVSTTVPFLVPGMMGRGWGGILGTGAGGERNRSLRGSVSDVRLRRDPSGSSDSASPFGRSEEGHERCGSSEGDVLGRILGWSADRPDRPRSANAIATFASASATVKSKASTESALPGLPEIFRPAETSGGRGRSETAGSARSSTRGSRSGSGSRARLPGGLKSSGAGLDLERLPADLVAELPSPTKADEELAGEEPPFARSRKVSSQELGRTGPASPTGSPKGVFGEGVKDRAFARRFSEADVLEELATPVSETPPVTELRPPRFQDPAIFDWFVEPAKVSLTPSISRTSSSAAPPDRLGRHHAEGEGEQRKDGTRSSTSLKSVGSTTTAHQITLTPSTNEDCRFVVWGEQKPDLRSNHSGRSSGGDAGPGSGRGSPSVPNKRWTRAIRPHTGAHHYAAPSSDGHATSTSSPAMSFDDGRSIASESSSTRVARGTAPGTKMIMAATLERWIAELTSVLDVLALVAFFLTYRSVISPLDLCYLLISRFEWALAASDLGPEENAARRIVRVRTFVVIRHWLLNHFEDDFLRNRELRSCLTAWLNAIAKDDRVKAAPEDLRIVKSLKKVVRQRKETFVAYNLAEAPPSAWRAKVAASVMPPAPTSEVQEVTEGEGGDVKQPRSSGTLRGAGGKVTDDADPAEEKTSDDDVDLEEVAATGALSPKSQAEHQAALSSPTPGANASPPLGCLANSRKSFSHPVGLSSLASAADLSGPDRKFGSGFALPQGQGTITRYFTTTMGSLGRFKRMLNNHSKVQPREASYSHPMKQGLELQPNEAGDLLYVKGGLDRYLDFFELKDEEGSGSSLSAPTDSGVSLSSPTTSDSLDTPMESGSEAPVRIVEDGAGLGIGGLQTTDLGLEARDPIDTPTKKTVELRESLSKETIRSERSVPHRHFVRRAEKNVGDLLTQNTNVLAPAQSWLLQLDRPTSVQLDDIDLSDDSDDDAPAQRKLRRLPAATDLKQALALRAPSLRSSIDTTSSIGTRRVPSMAASMFHRRTQSSASDSGSAGGIAVVDNFVPDGLESDDDEPGDVEAALRRLEGVIDADRQREKARKVEVQMFKSRQASKRCAIFLSDDDYSEGDCEDDAASLVESETNSDVQEQPRRASGAEDLGAVSIAQSPSAQRVQLAIPDSRPSRETLHSHTASSSSSRTKRRRVSRKGSIYRIFGNAATPRGSFWPSSAPKLPPMHRSFLLDSRTEQLCQQFCLIERDLLRGVTWQELVDGSWAAPSARRDTLSWEVFLKDRAREKVEARAQGVQPTSKDVAAVIARFNLTCNWVASELVLTSALDERVTLLAKFIRLAFKCYRQNNFQTLTQIIHGLQTPPVERLKRTWSKLGVWEARMFRDLKAFTSHQRNFKSLRSVQDSLADAYGPPGQNQASPPQSTSVDGVRMSTSAARAPTSSGCIPFLGVYLRDLTVTAELPAHLDPSDPGLPATAGPTLDDGGPPLYPLVNVHKHRLVAKFIQKVLAFQEAGLLYPYEADAPLFIRCLKIKSLDAEQLRRSSLMCEA